MKSTCCTLRLTGWRWMSLISDGYTLPSTVRSMIVFSPAEPDRATRRSRRFDRQADRVHAVAVDDPGDLIVGAQTARVGTPGATAGFGDENGLRHGDRLPSTLVPAPAGNPLDPAPRQVNTAASNATAPRRASLTPGWIGRGDERTAHLSDRSLITRLDRAGRWSEWADSRTVCSSLWGGAGSQVRRGCGRGRGSGRAVRRVPRRSARPIRRVGRRRRSVLRRAAPPPS